MTPRFRCTSQRRSAFTLLEAVIALLVLSSVIVSVLSLRSQAIAQGIRISERQFIEREAESLFRMLLAGMLDRPTRSEESANVTWKGTHLGREYEIVREYTQLENPMLETGRTVSQTITLWRYAVTLGDRTSTFYWHA